MNISNTNPIISYSNDYHIPIVATHGYIGTNPKLLSMIKLILEKELKYTC